MADPTTVNVALAIPTRGSDVGVWDTPVNGDFNSLDGFLGGVQIISASNTNIVLTAPAGSITPSGGPTQAQNAVLRFTGALTGNVQVTLPLPGYMIIENLTTGAFVLTFAGAVSGQVIGVEQGVTQRIYNDGTNVKFVNLQTVGSYLDICDATVPAWITACTVPPYLNCTGATFNATTYPYLNAKLGGNTLPDLRGVSRATLNQGTGRITTAGSGIDGNTRLSIGGTQTLTLTLAQLPTGITSPVSVTSLLNTLTAPVTGFGIQQISYQNGATGVPQVFAPGASLIPQNLVSQGSGTSNNTGGQAHPIMQPTTISGITLIRAA